MSLDQARNRVHSIISNLKASCLLLSSTNRECVKMHDVFRDLAILIATSNDYSFMVKASSGLKEWPSNLKLQYVMRMSLTNNDFSMFEGAGEYPELILLLLQNNPSLKSISDEFFAGMKALQVLDLSNIPCLEKLPSSLSSLTNLRTLCLDDNNLKDGSVLGDLTSIEILSMRKSSFSRFPEEIRRLTNLRLLDLTDSQVGEIPSKVFSSLSHLEELYMGGSYNDWKLEKSNSSRKATLTEVLSLERLNILHIDIGYHGCLTEEIIHRQSRLKKFYIHIGERLHSPTTYPTSMCLNIPGLFGVCNPFKNWLKSFLNTAEHLSIASWKDRSCLEEFPIDCLQSLKSLHFQQCHTDICFSTALLDRFQALQELQICSCHNLDTVFLSFDDHSPKNVLPRLTNLHIHDAPNLTSLWRGVAPSTGFQTLKYIKIENCIQIKILFPLSVAKILNHLQYLELSHCDVMEAIISANEAHEIQLETQSKRQTLTDTELMLRNLHADDLFPQLQTLKLKHMKNIRCVTQPKFFLDFPNMQQLIVLSCPFLELPLGNNSLQKLIQIKAEEKWFEELEFEDRQTKISLQLKFTGISTGVQSASEN
ncbi:probable disease resistance protein At4g27220 [Amaranthus tricolor]|uniref:probable disease resistance protein At4g27220 n=1 Tax=Amaranthus tricolor TaxID=29722 RepID=UPI00258720B3|nr:probable disease resistance protein At4g27220 [Amaranthus tricolor]